VVVLLAPSARFGEFERRAHVGARGFAVPFVAVYAGIALSFALPFVFFVDACTEDVARPVTGVELVTGAAADRSDVIAGGFDQDAKRAQLPAAVALGSAAVGAAVALAVALGRAQARRVPVVAALLVGAGLVTVFLENSVFNEPRAGLVIALCLAVGALLLSVGLARALWPPGEDPRRRFGRTAIVLGAIGWVLLLLALSTESDNGSVALGILGAGAHLSGLVAGLLGLFLARPTWSALLGTVLCMWPLAFALLLIGG
jgi:hypothetical protein